MILEFRHHLLIILKNKRGLKIKTQDDNSEQATKNFSLHHSKPIYLDFKLNFLLNAKKKFIRMLWFFLA